MWIILLVLSIILNIYQAFKIMEIESDYLGKNSSLKLEIAKLETEIFKMKQENEEI